MIEENILKNHSENAVNYAIEENLLTILEQDFIHVSKELTPHIYRSKEMLRYYSGIPFAFFNCVYALGFESRNLENRISEEIEYFRSKSVPHLWWIGYRSTPENIGEILIDNGLQKFEWDSPAMAMDIRELEDKKLQEYASRSGAQLRLVTSEEDLDKWMEVFRATSGWSDEGNTAYHIIIKHQLKEPKNCFVYIAEIEGEPVGISHSLLRAGVVGVYSVATIEEYRGKGIGSLVSLAGLVEGKKSGYEIGVLSSSEMGLNVYKNVGFKEFFKYRMYADTPQ